MAAYDDFKAKLAASRRYEIAFSNWLQSRGYHILPSYDYNGLKEDKAPRLQCGRKMLVLPDLLGFKGDAVWFEIKTKERADLYRKTGVLETGIALRHYKHYLDVKKITGSDVHIIFIHEQENLVATCEIGSYPVSHIYNGDLMDKGGTIFADFSQLAPVMRKDELNEFLEVTA